MQRQALFLKLFAFILMTLGLAAQTASAANHIGARIVAQSAVPKPGTAATLAIVFTPEPGWHGYWRNPGDAGLGARFDWALPKGVAAGEPLYPVPHRLVISGLMNHVYESEYALIVQLRIPRDARIGTALPIRAKAEWLACTDEICVPEQGELAIDLTVGDGGVSPADQARFDGWWAKMPRPLDQPGRFAVDGKRLRIAIPYPASAPLADPWFYAATEDAVGYAETQKITRRGDEVVIETASTGAVPTLEGVLSIGPDQGLSVSAKPGAVAAGVADAATGGEAGLVTTIILALGGAILGGLILNVMPCVFPIISLKALSLARAGGNEAAAKRDALAYAAGVIVTCLALGGLLLALRAGGAQVGWAFQLQEPRILFVLLVMAVAITANLAGLFHLSSFGGGQALVDKGGVQGSFWTGALAAFAATPCTGPFMAAALGAALVLPTAAALAIFAGLGLGLALPFLAIGFVPAIRKRMPKPGAWMANFQRILAIPMALTVAALGWLIWRQGGWGSLGFGLAMSAILVAGLIGITRASKPLGWSAIAGAMLMIGLLGGKVASLAGKPVIADAGAAFNVQRLAALQKAGTPVFLYFTADWCLTCKVNEKAAIERDEVAAAFEKAGVTMMVGDWTRGDPAITRFLNAHGVSGVPLYLFYPKGGGAPQQLPQVLTPGMLAGLAR